MAGVESAPWEASRIAAARVTSKAMLYPSTQPVKCAKGRDYERRECFLWKRCSLFGRAAAFSRKAGDDILDIDRVLYDGDDGHAAGAGSSAWPCPSAGACGRPYQRSGARVFSAGRDFQVPLPREE